MTVQTVKAVIANMENLNQHLETLEAFISAKKAKVIADDLVWLLDSLTEEQRLIAEGNDIEAKRLQIFEELGLSGKKAKQLIEESPEEFRAKLTLECTNAEKHIDRIKQLNIDITEIIERKLSIQEKAVKAPPSSMETYTGKGVKVRTHNTSGGFFSEV